LLTLLCFGCHSDREIDVINRNGVIEVLAEEAAPG
jgi:hypothetical protein